MVLELYSGGIAVSCGIAVTASHQGVSEYLTSFSEGRQISPTGSHFGTAKQKAKVKTLKTKAFSKTLGAGIILKLKTLGTKIL